jgi:uncharacterized membrane protein affecting hemolysin expression
LTQLQRHSQVSQVADGLLISAAHLLNPVFRTLAKEKLTAIRLTLTTEEISPDALRA